MRVTAWGSRSARRAAAAAFVAVLAGALAPTAGAATAKAASHTAERWPGKTITYVNRSRAWEWSVREAVAAWNAANVGIRFVPARSPGAAQVRISTFDFRAFGGAGTIAGQATLGYLGGRRGFVRLASPGSASWADRFVMARVAAHELGHVLGLEHTSSGCSIMVPALTGDRWGACERHRSSQWRCRLVERDDVRRAARLYRGKPRPARDPATCFRDAAPATPTELATEVSALEATPGRWVLRGRVRWVNPTSASFAGIRIVARLGSCAASPLDPDARVLFAAADDSLVGNVRWSRERGQPAAVAVSLADAEPGAWCVSAWASDDGALRHSVTAATTWVTVGPAVP